MEDNRAFPRNDNLSSEQSDSDSEHECRADADQSDSSEKDPFLQDSDAFRASLQTRVVVSRPISSPSSIRKFILGIVIVFVIAASWVGSTQTAKSTYTATYQQFRAPFFLVWFGTCWMSGVFLFTIPVYFIEKGCLPSSSGLKELMRYSFVENYKYVYASIFYTCKIKNKESFIVHNVQCNIFIHRMCFF